MRWIANYLSGKLNLPVFNNDIVRTEVQEDLGNLNEEEYKRRRDERLESIIRSGIPFIYDASVDRNWSMLHRVLEKAGYTWFIISLDLSENFLLKLYRVKGYHESIERLKQLLTDHQNFLKEYASEIALHITDEQFKDRLNIVLSQASSFIAS